MGQARAVVEPRRARAGVGGHPHLLHADDLAGGLLHLLELGEEIPEAALGHHCVGGEDLHLVERGLGVALGRELAAHNLKVLQLNHGHRQSDGA